MATGWLVEFLQRSSPRETKAARLRVPEFVPATKALWDEDWHGRADGEKHHILPAPIIAWVEAHFIQHYAWANQLSVYYANNYTPDV